MQVGVLVTGRRDPKMNPALPEYYDLFQRLFHRNDPSHTIRLVEIHVLDGEFPDKAEDFDGYLITGSAESVYQPLPWISRLLAFIKQIHQLDIPFAGICFGHQAIALALGGKVAESPKGWGVGIRRMPLLQYAPWMDEKTSECDLIYMHKDQVESLPKCAQVFMGDEFCPYGGFTVGDTTIAIQGHPELTTEFTRDLIRLRTGVIGRELTIQADKSLNRCHHGNRIGKWLVLFFNQNKAAPTDKKIS